jgi:hypothetical protein
MNLYSVLLFCFVLFFISCNTSEKQMPKEIYGRWVLDSTSGQGGKIHAGGPRGHTEFTLQLNKSFVYKWSDFDVFGDYKGTYDYIKMKDKSPSLIVFSIYAPEKKDSVIRLDSFTVLKLNDSILKTQEKETYTLLDSTVVIQNRINVYKKSNAPNKGF